MPNRYIIMLTITTIGMILACRVRNCDERFRRIVINGKIRNLFLFPVAVYNQTTIFSMVVCVSYEMLIGLALFSIINCMLFLGSFSNIFCMCGCDSGMLCRVEKTRRNERKNQILYIIHLFYDCIHCLFSNGNLRIFRASKLKNCMRRG